MDGLILCLTLLNLKLIFTGEPRNPDCSTVLPVPMCMLFNMKREIKFNFHEILINQHKYILQK